ncbi:MULTISPECIES: tyrosine-type recombinase/integrase [Bradyrhizobium]|uniref:Site-specific recombinase XerD n=2 Tax=Bradyrhizobium TaxID=374 RepID=A0ABY0PYX9_9BRAD|nr:MULTISPECIES: site-specific integrase [Bradyrhizobium]SDJ18234.1 Site-specific recombinase XerD [Bradyrhizobium ottawaense]SEC84356.1 Site-specific recombinase XerD [Bradyrhizobium lablabi]
MARTVKHAKLDSRTARLKLRKGRQPHWQELQPQNHLGYQRQKSSKDGRWVLRRYLGGGNKYRVIPLGLADDDADSDGTKILSFDQAKSKALAMMETPDGDKKIQRITVRQGMALYVAQKKRLGQSVADVSSRGTAHILPKLGDRIVSELTDEQLQQWLFDIAEAPAQNRPKKGVVQFRPAPVGEDAIRKRRATANRVLTMLKAILNYVYDKGHVSHRDAWGRKLKPFPQVDAPPVRYLSIVEVQRFYNRCESEFRPLVRGALETGARYAELARMLVADFNPDSGTVAVRKSKSGKARQIILTKEGAAFFKAHTAGRAGSELMFAHADGSPWNTSEQRRPILEANKNAQITPPITFHGTRHTWASHAVMNGTPLIVVAKNLGHRDTRQVERVYGHLAPGFVVDAIRKGAPKYGIKADKKVVPLR